MANTLRPAPALLEAAGEWSGLELTADYRGHAAPRLVLEESAVRGAGLAGADLSQARISDVGFGASDLSGLVLLEASLSRVCFRDCRLSGATLAGAQLRDVHFLQCRMDDIDLRMSHGSRVSAEGCRLSGADFYGAEWEEVTLYDCDLSGAEFSKVKLRSGRLHGSQVDGLKGAHYLSGVTISTGQVLPLALQVLSALSISVDDDRQR